MTTEEQITALEIEQLALRAKMQKSDAHAAKCAKEGLIYKDTYPSEYTEYIAANKQYNDNEATLAQLQSELVSAQNEDIIENQII